MNWQELSSTSHYKTALAVKNEIAKRDAHTDMQKQTTVTELSWQEVFFDDYYL